MADRLDEAFAKTTKLLFGKALSPMERYGKWLGSRVPGGRRVKSCFGTGEAYLPDYGYFKKIPHSRVSSREDRAKAGKPLITGADGITLASLRKAASSGAYFVPTYEEGNNVNAEDSFGFISCQDIRHCFDPFTSKKCAYALSIMDADSSFGLHRAGMPATFSIHCYNSYGVQRCFEMDSAINCSDSMFCHNVENLQNCIFCFNTKAKRYAIGNLEVGKEKYLEFRNKLCEEIVRQLESTGSVSFDIYDVLARKG